VIPAFVPATLVLAGVRPAHKGSVRRGAQFVAPIRPGAHVAPQCKWGADDMVTWVVLGALVLVVLLLWAIARPLRQIRNHLNLMNNVLLSVTSRSTWTGWTNVCKRCRTTLLIFRSASRNMPQRSARRSGSYKTFLDGRAAFIQRKTRVMTAHTPRPQRARIRRAQTPAGSSPSAERLAARVACRSRSRCQR
jgi:hypothetical protein